jgi:pantoate--beta-alanine ligase
MTSIFNSLSLFKPDVLYLGQKDIQQALILRRMAKELLLPTSIGIVPTVRDTTDSLALSSRNTYLNEHARTVADTLYRALRAAQTSWDAGSSKVLCLRAAVDVIEKQRVAQPLVDLKLDYINFNDAHTLEDVKDEDGREVYGDKTVLLTGALLVDGTRLIDNLILGDESFIFES